MRWHLDPYLDLMVNLEETSPKVTPPETLGGFWMDGCHQRDMFFGLLQL